MYTSKTLTTVHGMFTKRGGASHGPFRSLNLSFGVGDQRKHVEKNREIVKQELGIEYLVSSRQVHGNKVAVLHGVHQDLELNGVDALITAQPGIGLLIQQADCQAVLLFDPEKQVIGAIHNGWRGSVANIISKTLQQMRHHFHVNPSHIQAVISPSLGPCCAEFIHYRREIPPHLHRFQATANHFDFWNISKYQLEKEGVKPSRVKITGICTACNSNFFSYRRAKKNSNGVTGRNGSIIALAGTGKKVFSAARPEITPSQNHK